MTITLSKGQQEACERLETWWRGSPADRPFRLDGYAGTGKTTAVEHFIARLGLREHQVKLLAPTGKAARVLATRTGWPASTIHRELYIPMESEEVLELRKMLQETTDPKKQLDLRRALARRERRGGDLSFSSKGENVKALLFIVDEVSMVDQRVAHDLENLGVPLLLLGDPGQLPPVKGQPGFKKIRPDVTLTEILRQDEGSSILRAAELIRLGEGLPKTCDWGTFRRVRPKELGDSEYADFDVLLCGTHRVRKAFNRRLRRQFIEDLDETMADAWLPRAGDRLVCRANNYSRRLLNGQLLRSLSTAWEEDDLRVVLDMIDDEGMERHGEISTGLRFLDHYRRGIAVHRVERALEIDYAYALTVHSAQGSEWDRVVILNDWRGNQARQWLYTAVTRGAREVTLVG